MAETDKEYVKSEKGEEKAAKGTAVRGITRKPRKLIIKSRR